jgi:acyl carrier protein
MMTEKEFLKKMGDLLDTEAELTLDAELADLEEWDSLSFVSFLAMADAAGERKILPSAVREAVTVGDLFRLIKGE